MIPFEKNCRRDRRGLTGLTFGCAAFLARSRFGYGGWLGRVLSLCGPGVSAVVATLGGRGGGTSPLEIGASVGVEPEGGLVLTGIAARDAGDDNGDGSTRWDARRSKRRRPRRGRGRRG